MISDEIKLHYGCGDLKFGMTREEVEKLLGKNYKVDNENYGEFGFFLEYEDLGLDLAFMEEDDFRLGVITFSDSRYKLGADKIIGVTEEQMKKNLQKNGFESVVKDEELSEDELVVYFSEKLGLTINIVDKIVTDVIISVDLDDEGEPIWL